MPERPYRRRELHDHLVRSRTRGGPELQRTLRLHPTWPQCDADCGWPVDPAATGSRHPNCEVAT